MDKTIPKDFDYKFYQKYYKDLRNMSKDQLLNHYIKNGKKEKRIYNIKYIIPKDFDCNFYRNNYNDLKNMNNEQLMFHYIKNGKKENRIYKREIKNNNIIRFISLGGWCGMARGIKRNNVNLTYKSFPFDSIRSKFEGIIDCFENNFINFFPKNIQFQDNIGTKTKYFRFLHFDFRNNNVLNDYKNKITELNNYLTTTNDKIIFMRTIISKDYNSEINLYKKFIDIINKKYINLKYLLIFIIPEQNETKYFKNIKNNVFIFTLNDIEHDWEKIPEKYKPIFSFILENDLFNNIPEKNEIEINNNIGLETENSEYLFSE